MPVFICNILHGSPKRRYTCAKVFLACEGEKEELVQPVACEDCLEVCFVGLLGTMYGALS